MLYEATKRECLICKLLCHALFVKAFICQRNLIYCISLAPLASREHITNVIKSYLTTHIKHKFLRNYISKQLL